MRSISKFSVLCRSQLGSSFGSMPLSQKTEVIARWLVWNPFESELPAVADVTVDLAGGPGANPSHSFCFTRKVSNIEEVRTSFRSRVIFSCVDILMDQQNKF